MLVTLWFVYRFQVTVGEAGWSVNNWTPHTIHQKEVDKKVKLQWKTYLSSLRVKPFRDTVVFAGTNTWMKTGSARSRKKQQEETGSAEFQLSYSVDKFGQEARFRNHNFKSENWLFQILVPPLEIWQTFCKWRTKQIKTSRPQSNRNTKLQEPKKDIVIISWTEVKTENTNKTVWMTFNGDIKLKKTWFLAKVENKKKLDKEFEPWDGNRGTSGEQERNVKRSDVELRKVKTNKAVWSWVDRMAASKESAALPGGRVT